MSVSIKELKRLEETFAKVIVDDFGHKLLYEGKREGTSGIYNAFYKKIVIYDYENLAPQERITIFTHECVHLIQAYGCLATVAEADILLERMGIAKPSISKLKKIWDNRYSALEYAAVALESYPYLVLQIMQCLVEQRNRQPNCRYNVYQIKQPNFTRVTSWNSVRAYPFNLNRFRFFGLVAMILLQTSSFSPNITVEDTVYWDSCTAPDISECNY
jgi:hypothetical protein